MDYSILTQSGSLDVSIYTLQWHDRMHASDVIIIHVYKTIVQ